MNLLNISQPRIGPPFCNASTREEKKAEEKVHNLTTNQGNLSPDLQLSFQPEFPKNSGDFNLEKYVLTELREQEGRNVYKAHNLLRNENSICKVSFFFFCCYCCLFFVVFCLFRFFWGGGMNSNFKIATWLPRNNT